MKIKLSFQKIISIIIIIFVLCIIGYAIGFVIFYGVISPLIISAIVGGSSEDHFADELVIPNDIEINIPKGEKHPGKGDIPETIENKDYIDIELYNGLQGGQYWYYAWLDNLETGKIYLKAYEYTKNTELSSEQLLQKTEIEIDDIGENVIKTGPKNLKFMKVIGINIMLPDLNYGINH